MTSLSQVVLSSVGLPSFLHRPATRLFALDGIDRTYTSLQGSADFLPGLLRHMKVRYDVAAVDLKHIPSSGPAVIVANHPFGLLEAAVLLTAIRQIRSDVQVLANDLLAALPELQEFIIPVDIVNGSSRVNAVGMRQAVQFVTNGGLLIVFPAGAVSHFHWREGASVDPLWHPAIARLIRLCGKPAIIPIFVPGSNSLAFHISGMIHPSCRTALLARELLNKSGSSVELRIGRPVDLERFACLSSDQERIAYLRWRTYLLANRSAFAPDTRVFRRRSKAKPAQPIADAVPPELLAAEIDALPVLEQSGDLRVYLAPASQIPSTLREIGRLREITFRQAGEGTGLPTDLDRFDAEYLHLFVWNAAKSEVVGAYRLQLTEPRAALYTQTLFHFDERFLNAMGSAVELGRSFIRAEYQRGFAPLLLLWKGIGKFIAANPRCKVLFGPVSISNQYQAVSRELMIAFLEKHASLSEWVGLVRGRHAPANSRASRCSRMDELSDVISDIEPTRVGIPVLLRQYLKLGGKLLAFNVDAEFSDALDGLIVVDLTKTEPKLLERYLGKAEAASFLDFHKE